MPAFRDEILKDLVKALNKQNQIQDQMLEVLRESRDTQVELVKVMKDVKRLISVRVVNEGKVGGG